MLDIIVLGGPLMIPIVLCSVVALAVTLERWWYLHRCSIDTDDLMDDIKLAVQAGKYLEAMQIAKRSRGPVAAVVAAGIAYYDRDQEELRNHMDEVGQFEVVKLERRIPVLELIVAVAPMLGLLGTVTGLIDSFNVLAALQGLGEPTALSAGVAEALITTAAGLFVAIPTMIANSFLSNRIDRLVADMNKRESELFNVLMESRGEY